MSPTATARMLVIANIVVSGVGSIDTGIGGEWDLFVLFAMSLVVSIALLLRVESRRPAIPIRRDLVVWLRERASVSGEPLATVTDRAISTFVNRCGAPSDVKQVRE